MLNRNTYAKGRLIASILLKILVHFIGRRDEG